MTTQLQDTLNAALPPAAAEMLAAVRGVAGAMGLPVYLVGGSVRDLLLGRDTKDLDMSIAGDALRLASAVADQLGCKPVTHRRFGTATVDLGAVRLDFSMARSETYPHPGDLPQVTPSDMAEDLVRRDFSINAMALGLTGQDQDLLLDPCGGRDDLERGLVRVLHPASFIDDPTRMLRAVRYEQRLGFDIESDTLDLLQQAVSGNALATVSGDRLRRELELVLDEERPLLALHRAEQLGLLHAIQPGLSLAETGITETAGHRHNPLVYLAAMAYRLSSRQGEGLVSRLNMPGEWAGVVRDATALRSIADKLAAWEDPLPSQVVEMLEGKHECAVIAAWHSCAGNRAGQLLRLYVSKWRNYGPVLNGHDLADHGVPPGPETGRILRELRRARLDAQVSTREEEIALAQCLMEGASGAA